MGVDDYARGGTTWSTLRRSCVLAMIPTKDDIAKPRIRDEIELERIRTQQLSDSLATAAINQNAEVIRSASSLGVLWKLLTHPNRINSPAMLRKGYDLLRQNDCLFPMDSTRKVA